LKLQRREVRRIFSLPPAVFLPQINLPTPLDTTEAKPRFFVKPDSVVRRIWGDADVILFIFAASAAEFALNRAVDWLFFTGKLPADPLGRLFSTVRYSQEIVFAETGAAEQAIGRMSAIHAGVEAARGAQIPAWAYRDVLYMLIDYSERAYRLLHRPLRSAEQEELYDVFRRVGAGMGIPDLPTSYADWQADRQIHLDRDLVRSEHTKTLFSRYREALGRWRYRLLLDAQALLVPEAVHRKLRLPQKPRLACVLPAYRAVHGSRLRSLTQRVLVPPAYLDQVRQLDRSTG
jgi:uncharacterized protein (DUF2236 family)